MPKHFTPARNGAHADKTALAIAETASEAEYATASDSVDALARSVFVAFCTGGVPPAVTAAQLAGRALEFAETFEAAAEKRRANTE
jgi:hypothetical protein